MPKEETSKYEFDRKTENMVANFRGLPGKPRRGRVRKIKDAGSVIDKIIDKFQITTPKPETELMHQWDYIVGEHNAHRCAPVRIQNGTLHIGCPHPTLSRELHMSKRMILRRIKNVCPSINDVRFIVA